MCSLLWLPILSTLLWSCSSTKTAVGGGLLTDITGQISRRDTLFYPLSDTASVSHASVSMHLSHSGGSRLLVGKANNLRGTMLLKFAPVAAWGEEYLYDYQGSALYDTLTITPVAIETDSTSELRLTFEGFVTDSSRITLSGWTTDAVWYEEDSVTTPLPAPEFRVSLFSGVSPDSIAPGDIVRASILPAKLSALVSDTLSLAVQGDDGTPMHRYVSRDGILSYSPQVVLWVKATVESKRTDLSPQDATRDTVVGLSLRPVQDVFRLKRLDGQPVPDPDVVLLASGAAWRGFVRLNRFDIPGAIDGVIPKETTVNSAVLELVLDSLKYTFQRDEAHIEVHPLGEAFDFQKAQNNELVATTRIGSSSGFYALETRVDSTGARLFQIADLLNRWRFDTTSNRGLILNLNATSTEADIEEDSRVDAVEITGVRLVLTTTLPPVFVQKPPSAAASEAQRPEEAQ